MPNKKVKAKKASIIPDENIVGKIYFIRGEKVMFDKDLATLYGVTTGNLNKAVKRNVKRFPEDFMFQLNEKEAGIFSRFHFGSLKDENLRFQNGISSEENSRYQIGTLNKDDSRSSRSQIVTLKRGKNIKYLPYVFTEQGVAMLSSVLKSSRAIEVNIQIMRTFTKMRKLLATHKELSNKIEKMEKENKENFKIIFKVITKLMAADPGDKKVNRIGFA